MSKARDLVVPQVTLAKVRTIVEAVAGGAADVAALGAASGIAPRAVGYALDGARALALVEEAGGELVATPWGRALATSAPGSEEERGLLLDAMRASAVLRAVAPDLLEAREPTRERVAKQIATATDLGPGTADERARVLLRWRRAALPPARGPHEDDVKRATEPTPPRAAPSRPSSSTARTEPDLTGPQITRLRVLNWRNFKKADLTFGQRTFFVGPNASGKSNLLDALRFLRDVAVPTGSLAGAAEDRGGLAHIRSLHAQFVSRVEIEVRVRLPGDVEEWGYLLALVGSPAKKEPMRVHSEVVTHGATKVLERPEPHEQGNHLLLSQTHLEQASQTLKFRPLVEALASLEVVHVVPQVARTAGRSEEFSRREAPGSDFIDQIAKLSDQKKKQALGRIEKLLRIAVPRFSNLDIERDEIGRPHLKAQYAHWRNRGGWQTERDFSDGTLRLIGLLWAIDHGRAPLILEEPELSLHRDVIRQLPQIFAAASSRRGRQVLVSSHAAELLDDPGIDPSEVVILTPTEHETTARLGSAESQLVAAATAGLALGPIVSGLTRPSDIAQLPRAFVEGARR